MAAITLEGISKTFDGGHAAVREVSLDIADGELVVLVGPSGSGKSTLLRLIAGLERPTGGRMLIGGRDVTTVPPQERDLAMVFQSYALYPHKTVRENLAFGLRMRAVPRADIDTRVRRTADALQIQHLLDRRPSQLSGGQRQRVALGRAIVREPTAFLLDEPLSNLDPGLRLDTRTELALLHRRLGTTMVYVTHDQEEAMKLGERVVLLRDGQVEQVAPPMEIYRRPATLFAARFFGSPPMNLMRGLAGFAADQVIGVRPQDVSRAPLDTADVQAIVEVIEPAGSELHVHLRTDEAAPQRLVMVLPSDGTVSLDERIGIHLRRDRVHVFDAPTAS